MNIHLYQPMVATARERRATNKPDKPAASKRQFTDLNSDLHIRERLVFVFDPVRIHEFLPGLPFLVPPSATSKVFIKQNDGAHAQPFQNKVQHRSS